MRLTLNIEAYEYTAMASDVGLVFVTAVDDSLAVIRPADSFNLQPGIEWRIVVEPEFVNDNIDNIDYCSVYVN